MIVNRSRDTKSFGKIAIKKEPSQQKLMKGAIIEKEGTKTPWKGKDKMSGS